MGFLFSQWEIMKSLEAFSKARNRMHSLAMGKTHSSRHGAGESQVDIPNLPGSLTPSPKLPKVFGLSSILVVLRGRRFSEVIA